LKEKNDALLTELRRLNDALDSKLANGLPKNEALKPEQEEEKINNEIECLKRICITFEKEIESLNSKVKLKAGPEKVIELEKKIVDGNKRSDVFMKNIKDLEKKVKDMDKEFEKDYNQKESGYDKNEVILKS